MLTVKEAKRIALNACIDKIGRDFVLAHRNNGVSACGEDEKNSVVYCYVGVDDKPYVSPAFDGTLTLDSTSHFPYFAKCHVSLLDGSACITECAVPQ